MTRPNHDSSICKAASSRAGNTRELELKPKGFLKGINGLGEPMDELGKLSGRHALNPELPKVSPLKRQPVTEPLDVGVRAITALLTLGKGHECSMARRLGVSHPPSTVWHGVF